jgi:hypothetical protein
MLFLFGASACKVASCILQTYACNRAHCEYQFETQEIQSGDVKAAMTISENNSVPGYPCVTPVRFRFDFATSSYKERIGFEVINIGISWSQLRNTGKQGWHVGTKHSSSQLAILRGGQQSAGQN